MATKEEQAAQKAAAEEQAAAQAEASKLIEATEGFEKTYAPLIRAKVRAGLTDTQARACILAQIKEDPLIAKAQLAAVSKK